MVRRLNCFLYFRVGSDCACLYSHCFSGGNCCFASADFPPIQPHQIHQFLSDFHELKLTARGNTPFSFGGIMKRITTFIESFSDTELLIGAVGIFVVCLVVMIGIASCCSDVCRRRQRGSSHSKAVFSYKLLWKSFVRIYQTQMINDIVFCSSKPKLVVFTHLFLRRFLPLHGLIPITPRRRTARRRRRRPPLSARPRSPSSSSAASLRRLRLVRLRPTRWRMHQRRQRD
jgi:hypothetical protein